MKNGRNYRENTIWAIVWSSKRMELSWLPHVSGYFWIRKFFFAWTVLNIHGQELDSILWRWRIKKYIYKDFASTRLADLKLFTLERGYTHRIRVYGSRIQKEKLRIRLKYLDGVCGRGLNVFLLNCTTFLESWSHECGFKCYWGAHKNGAG